MYNEKVGIDEKGLPIHSSMYKSLKTNLPKVCNRVFEIFNETTNISILFKKGSDGVSRLSIFCFERVFFAS